MKKYSLIIIGAAVVVVGLFFTFKGSGKSEVNEVILPVKSGKFVVDITTTGELEAKNSVKIQGPTRLREHRIYNVTINDIVPEGTVVKKGEWIANLDRSEFNTKLQDQQIELEQAQSQYIQTQLDTALQMRQARDELINLEYSVVEAELVLEQSAYEPPATVKQNEINLEKAKRNFQQAKDNYVIKFQQNKAKMADVAAERRKSQRELDSMMDLANSFTVFAPEDGMVIYAKGWDGKAIKAGSQINSWDPTVATLPDLTTMVSKTYINEVDVRKIKPGQRVEVGLDAFPEKKLTGTVIKVANVGEQRPNSDAKVFQVNVEIDGRDELLRPSMTTSNTIVISVEEEATFVPLECLHTENDSITFVYKNQGMSTVKQEVEVGATNANEAIILAGVDSKDRVYLSIPSEMEGKSVNLIPEMDGKRQKEETVVEDEPREIRQRPGGRRMRGDQPGGGDSQQQPAGADKTKKANESN